MLGIHGGAKVMNYGATALSLLVVRGQRIGIGKGLGWLNWTWSFSWGYEINNCLMQYNAMSVILCGVFCGIDFAGLFLRGPVDCLVWVLSCEGRRYTCKKSHSWYWSTLKAEGRMKYVFVQEWSSPYTCVYNIIQIYIYTHPHTTIPWAFFPPRTGLKSHDHAIATATSGTRFAASMAQSLAPTESVMVQRPARSSVPRDDILMGKATGTVSSFGEGCKRESLI